jgi:hypothetical protein
MTLKLSKYWMSFIVTYYDFKNPICLFIHEYKNWYFFEQPPLGGPLKKTF